MVRHNLDSSVADIASIDVCAFQDAVFTNRLTLGANVRLSIL